VAYERASVIKPAIKSSELVHPVSSKLNFAKKTIAAAKRANPHKVILIAVCSKVDRIGKISFAAFSPNSRTKIACWNPANLIQVAIRGGKPQFGCW